MTGLGPGLDPVDRIKWVAAETLDPNDWNPNVVIGPEWRLLERNILTAGYTQSLIAQRADGLIIDGFHRRQMALESKKLVERYHGMVPVVFMDLSRAEAMMLTVRMNRAKGTHVAIRMSELVQRLVKDEGCDVAEVALGIGATPQEVEHLLDGSLIVRRDLKNYKYGNAWVPKHVQGSKADHDAAEAEAALAFEREDAEDPDAVQ